MSRKDEIIHLGLDLIQKRGVNGFSFADIADTIGIKKASIHYYFKSKSDLIEAIVDWYVSDYFLKLEKISKVPKREALATFVGLYRENLSENKICLCTDLSLEVFHLTAGVTDKVVQFFIKNEDWLAELIGSKDKAQHFYSCLLGAQVMARSLGPSYFDTVVKGELDRLAD